MTVAAGLLVLMAVAAAGPDTIDVSGSWTVKWAQAVRVNADLSVEIQRWGEAELVLEQEGGAVRGTWTTDVVERVTWTVEGSVEGDRLQLRSVDNDSDDSQLAMVESVTWVATLTEERLEGIVRLRIRGREREPAERPFSGCRRGC